MEKNILFANFFLRLFFDRIEVVNIFKSRLWMQSFTILGQRVPEIFFSNACESYV